MNKKQVFLNPIYIIIVALLFMSGCCSKDYFGTCTDDGALAEEPVAEEPVAEEPVAEEPVAEEAVVNFCQNLTEQFNDMSPEDRSIKFKDSINMYGTDLRNCDNEDKTFEIHLGDNAKEYFSGGPTSCGTGDLELSKVLLSAVYYYTSLDGTIDNLIASLVLEYQFEDQLGYISEIISLDFPQIIENPEVYTTTVGSFLGPEIVFEEPPTQADYADFKSDFDDICHDDSGDNLYMMSDLIRAFTVDRDYGKSFSFATIRLLDIW